MADYLVVVGILVTFLSGFALAALRFARRRRREGNWNASGPVDPTFAEPNPDLRAQGIRPPTIESE
jgi:hypothetical protein